MTGSGRRRLLRGLPEAVGRTGQVGRGEPARHVVALGDSVAAGVGVGRGEHTVAGRLATLLATSDEPVSWALHARGGLTARGVRALLGRSTTVDDLRAADVVVLSVGMNDLQRLHPLVLWRHDLASLLARLTSSTAAQVVLLGLPPIAALPSVSRPVRVVLAPRALRMERVGVTLAASYGVYHLPLPARLLSADGVFADDGFHPSAQSHDHLARLVAAVLDTPPRG